MGDLNFSKYETAALNAADARSLDTAIEYCLENRSSHALNPFRLDSCGAYVSAKAREFDSALRALAAARAPKKTNDTWSKARRAGGSLGSALRQTQEALEKQLKEGEIFCVLDDVAPPIRFKSKMAVRVCYRWRASTGDPWTVGAIEFTHSMFPRNDCLRRPSMLRPSSVTAVRKKQAELYAEWNQLRMLALGSVRDFFRDGGLAKDIPTTFPVRLDSYSTQLNNYSANFWMPQLDNDGH